MSGCIVQLNIITGFPQDMELLEQVQRRPPIDKRTGAPPLGQQAERDRTKKKVEWEVLSSFPVSEGAYSEADFSSVVTRQGEMSLH